jgi:hypothetical protein
MPLFQTVKEVILRKSFAEFLPRKAERNSKSVIYGGVYLGNDPFHEACGGAG